MIDALGPAATASVGGQNQMQSWLILVAAIACEVSGTTFMKLSDSLTKWVWIPPMLVAYVLALLGLALALRTIEVGIAYAVWAGVGTLLVATIGVLFFSESVSPLKLASILLVVAGVVGLNLADSLAHR
jgi:small multidrug resistance pump